MQSMTSHTPSDTVPLCAADSHSVVAGLRGSGSVCQIRTGPARKSLIWRSWQHGTSVKTSGRVAVPGIESVSDLLRLAGGAPQKGPLSNGQQIMEGFVSCTTGADQDLADLAGSHG